MEFVTVMFTCKIMSEYPSVAGHEVVGVIERVGDAARGMHEIGDRVGVACAACIRGSAKRDIVKGNKGGFQELL